MNRNIQILTRILAVVSAVTLLACYVARSQRQTENPAAPVVAPGSKSAPVQALPVPQRHFAPGSKSAPVNPFMDRQKSAPPQPRAQPAVQRAPNRQ